MQIISVVHWLATCWNSPHMRSPRVVKYFIPMLSEFRAISKHFTFSAGASSCITQTPSFCSGPKIYLYILTLHADLWQRLKSTLPIFYDAVVVWLPSLKLSAWVLNEVTSSHIRLTADYWLSPRLILTLPVSDFFVCVAWQPRLCFIFQAVRLVLTSVPYSSCSYLSSAFQPCDLLNIVHSCVIRNIISRLTGQLARQSGFNL